MKTLLKIAIVASLIGAAGVIAYRPAATYWAQRSRVTWETASIERGDITRYVNSTGTVQPVLSVSIGSFVSGPIVELNVDFNDEVKVGDVLARVDPRLFKANVDRDEATLATRQAELERVEAQLQQALNNYIRGQKLRQTNQDFMSDREMDVLVFEVKSLQAQRKLAKASIQQSQASLETSRANLNYCEVTAPVDGVIGLALASQGALVTASQANPLTVIRRIDPVRVDVTQSAAEIIRWQRLSADAALPEGADQTVSLQLADGSTFENTGSLTAAEPRVDETTGVVTLRMEFANPDGLLLPGMYVQAEIPQAFLRDVVLAPQEGVTRDRRGRPIAMVVNAENMVETRSLEIAQDRGSDWIVTEGLKDGDRLIVEGLQMIGEGMPVTPEERGSEPAAQGEGASAGGESAEGEAPAEETSAPEADPAQENAAPAEEEPAQEDAAPAEEAAEAQDDTGN